MKLLPSYYIEVLAFHEGIPGHHFQTSITQEFAQIPEFRKHLMDQDSYTEGWGLYAEQLPAQMGFYQDPYSEFGKLSLELFRACRLVVDVGIHYKGWTKQQAIDYMLKNTPNHEDDIVKEVERYFVMPAQATSYYIGMEKIQALRNKAQNELGKTFDYKEFHDEVLLHGAVPIAILEQNVYRWIEKKKQTVQ